MIVEGLKKADVAKHRSVFASRSAIDTMVASVSSRVDSMQRDFMLCFLARLQKELPEVFTLERIREEMAREGWRWSTKDSLAHAMARAVENQQIEDEP